jgi:PAS domain S-box-containing protein
MIERSWNLLTAATTRIESAATPVEMAAIFVGELTDVLVGVSRLALTLIEHDEGGPFLSAAAFFPSGENWLGAERFAIGSLGTLGQAASSRAAVSWRQDDDQAQAIPESSESIEEIGIPLLAGQNLLGVLLLTTEGPMRIDADEIALATFLCGRLALSLHNLFLANDMERAVERSDAIANISQALNETLELEAVFEMIVDAARLFLPDVDQAVIHLLEADEGESYLRPAAVSPRSRTDNSADFSTVRMRPGRGVAGLVLQEGKLINIRDVRTDPRFVSSERAPKFRSILVCPLQSRGQRLGTISIQSPEPGAFTSDAERLMSELGVEAAIAIEKARQFDALKKERLRLDAILRSMADGVLVVNPAGDIELVNQSMVDFIGLPLSRMLGHPVDDLPAGEVLRDIFRQAHSQPDSAVNADYEPEEGTYLNASVAVISGDEEESLGLVAAVRDVTREREVDRMKTDFISTVSHELRTPLTSVLGFVKLIRRTLDRNVWSFLPEDTKSERIQQRVLDNLNIIESEGRRLTHLINEVLDISKMESGSVEWQIEEIDLGSVLDNAISATSIILENRPVKLNLKMDDDLPLIAADADRFVQVFQNLISNAAKFTDKGSIDVSLKWVQDGQLDAVRGASYLRPSQLPGSWLVASVSDTGIGIERKDLRLVFDRFKQVGDSLTDRPKGTGLGLPICKEIVDYHNGHIWVESEVGSGSKFSFALPYSRVQTDELARSDELQPAEVADRSLVLVVDDEEFTRRLLIQLLQEAGYRVAAAEDGQHALGMARKHPPDLIILDVMMPQLDGFDTLVLLKNDPLTAKIPVMFLSVVESHQRGLKLGAAAYMTKPFDSNRLVDKVNQLVQLSSIAAGQPRQALLIDSEAYTRVMVRRVLESRGLAVADFEDIRQALREMGPDTPDLVIVSLSSIESSTPELVQSLRRWAVERPVHFLVIDPSNERQMISAVDSDSVDNLAADVWELVSGNPTEDSDAESTDE